MGDIVKINNTLTSTATNEALSAYQGQVLNTTKLTGQIVAATPTDSSTTNDTVYVHYDNINTSSNIMATIRDAIFPIGTIYQSTSSQSPQDLFGGSWSRIGEGRFLIGANSTYTAGSTNGAATVTLTAAQSGRQALTAGWNGDHTHTHVWKNGSLAQATSGSNTKTIYNSGGSDGQHVYTWGGNDGSHYHTGGGIDAIEAHNNMPPYKAVYMWVRTA